MEILILLSIITSYLVFIKHGDNDYYAKRIKLLWKIVGGPVGPTTIVATTILFFPN